MHTAEIRLSLHLKSLSAQGHFAGYASVFDVVDGQNDVVLRGAFEKTLSGRAGSIKLLWQHQPEEPVGVITHIFEDRRGLFLQGKLQLEVARAQEAYALMKSGALSGLSIGYAPVRQSLDPQSGVRRLAEVELFEISLVTFPANPRAQVTVVKSLSGEPPPDWRDAQRNGQLIALSDALARARDTLRNS
jgi:HK97 family phage prohead protease